MKVLKRDQTWSNKVNSNTVKILNGHKIHKEYKTKKGNSELNIIPSKINIP